MEAATARLLWALAAGRRRVRRMQVPRTVLLRADEAGTGGSRVLGVFASTAGGAVQDERRPDGWASVLDAVRPILERGGGVRVAYVSGGADCCLAAGTAAGDVDWEALLDGAWLVQELVVPHRGRRYAVAYERGAVSVVETRPGLPAGAVLHPQSSLGAELCRIVLGVAAGVRGLETLVCDFCLSPAACPMLLRASHLSLRAARVPGVAQSPSQRPRSHQRPRPRPPSAMPRIPKELMHAPKQLEDSLNREILDQIYTPRPPAATGRPALQGTAGSVGGAGPEPSAEPPSREEILEFLERRAWPRRTLQEIPQNAESLRQSLRSTGDLDSLQQSVELGMHKTARSSTHGDLRKSLVPRRPAASSTSGSRRHSRRASSLNPAKAFLAGLMSGMETVQQELYELERQVDAQNGILSRYDEAAERLEGETRKARTALRRFVSERNTIVDDMSLLHGRFQEADRRRKALRALDAANKHTSATLLKDKEREVRDLWTCLATMSKDLQLARERSQQASEDAEYFELQRERLDRELASMQSATAQLRDQVGELEGLIQSRSMEASDVEARLQAVRTRLDAIISNAAGASEDDEKLFAFNISDLLKGLSETGRTLALVTLEDLFARHHDELIEIFRHYANVGRRDEDRELDVGMLELELEQYAGFVEDIGGGLDDSRCRWVFLRTYAGPKFRSMSLFDEEDRPRRLPFGLFAESLIRLAVEVYPAERNLALAAGLLLTTRVLARAQRLRVDDTAQVLESSAVRELLNRQSDAIRAVFDAHADSHSRTLSLSAFLGFVGAGGVVDQSLSYSGAVTSFLRSCPPDEDEVAFEEFLSCLVRCSQLKYRKMDAAEALARLIGALVGDADKPLLAATAVPVGEVTGLSRREPRSPRSPRPSRPPSPLVSASPLAQVMVEL